MSMERKLFLFQRFLSTLLMISLSLGISLPSSAYALRQRGSGPEEIGAELLSGLEEDEISMLVRQFIRDMDSPLQSSFVSPMAERVRSRLYELQVLSHGFGKDGYRKAVSVMLHGTIKPLTRDEAKDMRFDEPSISSLGMDATMAAEMGFGTEAIKPEPPQVVLEIIDSSAIEENGPLYGPPYALLAPQVMEDPALKSSGVMARIATAVLHVPMKYIRIFLIETTEQREFIRRALDNAQEQGLIEKKQKDFLLKKVYTYEDIDGLSDSELMKILGQEEPPAGLEEWEVGNPITHTGFGDGVVSKVEGDQLWIRFNGEEAGPFNVSDDRLSATSRSADTAVTEHEAVTEPALMHLLEAWALYGQEDFTGAVREYSNWVIKTAKLDSADTEPWVSAAQERDVDLEELKRFMDKIVLEEGSDLKEASRVLALKLEPLIDDLLPAHSAGDFHAMDPAIVAYCVGCFLQGDLTLSTDLLEEQSLTERTMLLLGNSDAERVRLLAAFGLLVWDHGSRAFFLDEARDVEGALSFSAGSGIGVSQTLQRKNFAGHASIGPNFFRFVTKLHLIGPEDLIKAGYSLWSGERKQYVDAKAEQAERLKQRINDEEVSEYDNSVYYTWGELDPQYTEIFKTEVGVLIPFDAIRKSPGFSEEPFGDDEYSTPGPVDLSSSVFLVGRKAALGLRDDIVAQLREEYPWLSPEDVLSRMIVVHEEVGVERAFLLLTETAIGQAMLQKKLDQVQASNKKRLESAQHFLNELGSTWRAQEKIEILSSDAITDPFFHGLDGQVVNISDGTLAVAPDQVDGIDDFVERLGQMTSAGVVQTHGPETDPTLDALEDTLRQEGYTILPRSPLPEGNMDATLRQVISDLAGVDSTQITDDQLRHFKGALQVFA